MDHPGAGKAQALQETPHRCVGLVRRGEHAHAWMLANDRAHEHSPLPFPSILFSHDHQLDERSIVEAIGYEREPGDFAVALCDPSDLRSEAPSARVDQNRAIDIMWRGAANHAVASSASPSTEIKRSSSSFVEMNGGASWIVSPPKRT